MPSIPDPLNDVRQDLKKDNLKNQEREIQDRFNEMTLTQLFNELKKGDKDSKERKQKLMALLKNILSSFKKDASNNMSDNDAAQISKAGNANSDHGSSAKAK